MFEAYPLQPRIIQVPAAKPAQSVSHLAGHNLRSPGGADVVDGFAVNASSGNAALFEAYPLQPMIIQVPAAKPAQSVLHLAGHNSRSAAVERRKYRGDGSVEADTTPMTRVDTIAINRRFIIIRSGRVGHW